MKKIICSPAIETRFQKKVFTLAYPHMLFQQEADTYLTVFLSKYFSLLFGLNHPSSFS